MAYDSGDHVTSVSRAVPVLGQEMSCSCSTCLISPPSTEHFILQFYQANTREDLYGEGEYNEPNADCRILQNDIFWVFYRWGITILYQIIWKKYGCQVMLVHVYTAIFWILMNKIKERVKFKWIHGIPIWYYSCGNLEKYFISLGFFLVALGDF